MTALSSFLLALALQSGPSVPRDPDNTFQNHYIVELRIQVGGHWFRLDTGPRNYEEATILLNGLRDILAGSGETFRVMCFDLEMQSPVAQDTCDPLPNARRQRGNRH